jgi:putative DNA primase/helicase
MSFQQFAEQNGLIINHLIHDRWTRVPTVDKPQSRNGAYIFDGNSGAVQNWAIHEKPVSYKGKHDPHFRSKVQVSKDTRADDNQKAASKAGWIMNNSTRQAHPYLTAKGFPDATGYVWNDALLIPMRIDQKLVGLQMIHADGKKHFLKGQITKGAEAIIDAKGADILCEGFATGLSIRRALKAVNTRYTIHVCFSAGNIKAMAKKYPECVIVADHDPVGIKVAKESGRPYWVSPNSGEDFNDYELRVGAELAGKSLTALGLSVAAG